MKSRRSIILRLFLLLLATFFLYQGWLLGHLLWWRDHPLEETSFMREQLQRLKENNPNTTLKQQWVAYNKISVHLKRALIASEDAKFLNHDGFDWEGMQNAWEKNIKKGRIVAGGSTISQQLAKNLFLSSARTPWRKLQEAFITIMMESVIEKQRIFEIYLNVIEWGDGVFGAEAAAQHYYRVPAAQLSPAQAAKLSAMITNPRYYEDHRQDAKLLRKTAIIARRMPYADIP